MFMFVIAGGMTGVSKLVDLALRPRPNEELVWTPIVHGEGGYPSGHVVYAVLVFGMIEYGRMVMVQQILTNASREGARKAVIDGMTSSDVETAVQDYLSDAAITGANVTVTTTAPVAPDYADSMTVDVDVAFSQVSWLPSPMFLGSKQMSASTTMRKETVN